REFRLRFAGIADRAFAAPRADEQLWAAGKPALGDVVMRPDPAEPSKVFVRQFYYVGHRNHAAQAREVAFAVRDEGAADIGIEHRHAARMLATHEGFVGRSAWLGDEADAGEVQRVDAVREFRKVALFEHATGRVLVEEGVAGVAVVKVDEGKRGRPRRVAYERQVDAAVLKRAGERLAEKVGRKAGEEPGRDAQSAQCNGRVEDRAADIGRVGFLALDGPARQHVDQGFAAAEDHPVLQ